MSNSSLLLIQFGRLLDDAAMGCYQAGHTLVEDDLQNSRHVAYFLPRRLDVKLTWERLLIEEETAVDLLSFRKMSAEPAVRGRVLMSRATHRD